MSFAASLLSPSAGPGAALAAGVGAALAAAVALPSLGGLVDLCRGIRQHDSSISCLGAVKVLGLAALGLLDEVTDVLAMVAYWQHGELEFFYAALAIFVLSSALMAVIGFIVFNKNDGLKLNKAVRGALAFIGLLPMMEAVSDVRKGKATTGTAGLKVRPPPRPLTARSANGSHAPPARGEAVAGSLKVSWNGGANA